jgi:hypothetical protein
MVGGEHCRKELFKLLVNSYSEHLHMGLRPAENARNSLIIPSLYNISLSDPSITNPFPSSLVYKTAYIMVKCREVYVYRMKTNFFTDC